MYNCEWFKVNVVDEYCWPESEVREGADESASNEGYEPDKEGR